MLIYIFVERFPNPYKPYFDAQFACLLRKGHRIRIFASDRYTSTVNKEVALYGLDEKTSYYPTTLRTLPKFFKTLLVSFVRNPVRRIAAGMRILNEQYSLKKKFMMVMRMALLPLEGPDICLVHNIGTATFFSFLPGLYPKANVVMYFHGGEIACVPRIKGVRSAFEKMMAVFTNTEFSKQLAIRRGCEAEKIVINPVGFNLPDYSADGIKEYRKDGVLRLVSVGRLGEEKGLIYSMKAVKALVDSGMKNFEYRIVGTGYVLPLLKDFVDKNGIGKHVKFSGEKSKEGVVAELESCDVLVLPSISTETSTETQACVVQEAMLMRLVVLTTITGGVPESIPEEMRRFSVVCGDEKAIAEKVMEIMALTNTEMEELGNRGREFVLEGYDIDAVTEELLKKTVEIARD